MKKKSPKFSIKSSGKISHLKSQISPNYSLSLIIYIDWQLPPPPDRLAHIYSTAMHHLHPTRGKSEHFCPQSNSVPLIPTCATAPSLDLHCLGVSEGRQRCLGLDRGKEMLWEKMETGNTCLQGWIACCWQLSQDVYGVMGTSCGQKGEVQFLLGLFLGLNPSILSS